MQIGKQPYPFSDLSKYYFADKDDSSTPQYYGAVDIAGAWYILKIDGNAIGRYATGSSNYSQNWTNRASLTYSYLYNVTLY